jgi:hypothetical protein
MLDQCVTNYGSPIAEIHIEKQGRKCPLTYYTEADLLHMQNCCIGVA